MRDLGLGSGISKLRFVALAALVAFSACDRKSASTQNSAASAATDSPAENAGVASQKLPPPPAEIWKEFSGDNAFAEVRRQVEIGPRPAGSPALENARALIVSFLEKTGWRVERQKFTDTTPHGSVKFVNLIARFAGDGVKTAPANTQRAIVASHYDTKIFTTIQFVGANDGASSTGALLELARVLALDPALAAKIELAFFDGEEAVTAFSETDGLYGSRHYARALRDSGRAKQFQFGILWDMIGDKDVTITLPPDSPKELTKAILDAATDLGVRDRFSILGNGITDDHVPLNSTAHIPSIDLIDFNSLHLLYWHTADDKLDKISPASLQTVGAVTLYHLHKALSK